MSGGRRHRHLVCVGLAVLLLGGLGAGTAAAALEKEPVYDAGDKLTRGLANVLFGFLEIPRNIHVTTADDGMLAGWTVGIGKGLGWMGLRLLAGVYETLTFFIEEPNHYAPVVEPEYVWQAEGPRIK